MGSIVDLHAIREQREAQKKPSESTVSVSSGSVANKVFSVVSSQEAPDFSLYVERLGKNKNQALEFFHLIREKGVVTLVSEEEVPTLQSILRVDIDDLNMHVISVHDLVWLTEPVLRSVGEDDIRDYLDVVFREIGVHMNRSIEPISIRIMDEEGLETFDPEHIYLAWGDSEIEDGSYGCGITDSDGSYLHFSKKDFLEPEKTKLLHLLCLVREEYIDMGCSLSEDGYFELQLRDGGIDIQKIPFAFIEPMLWKSIAKWYPEYNKLPYSNYPLSKRITSFFDDVVSPMLSTEPFE